MGKPTHVSSTKALAYSFGIEIECTLPRASIRNAGISIGPYHHGHPLPFPFPAGWTAEDDGSLRAISGYRPLEIVSPVLRGVDGLRQVMETGRILRELGVKIHESCGLHCHVGVESVTGCTFRHGVDALTAEWVSRLTYLVAKHTDALYAVTGTPKREQGTYARNIKNGDWGEGVSRHRALADSIKRAHDDAKGVVLMEGIRGFGRYALLNLRPIYDKPYNRKTVEFRQFSGTANPTKLVAFIQLALGLCERAFEKVSPRWDESHKSILRSAKGLGERALEHLLRELRWTLRGGGARREEEAPARGFILELSELERVMPELKRLAGKYDTRRAAAGIAPLLRTDEPRRRAGRVQAQQPETGSPDTETVGGGEVIDDRAEREAYRPRNITVIPPRAPDGDDPTLLPGGTSSVALGDHDIRCAELFDRWLELCNHSLATAAEYTPLTLNEGACLVCGGHDEEEPRIEFPCGHPERAICLRCLSGRIRDDAIAAGTCTTCQTRHCWRCGLSRCPDCNRFRALGNMTALVDRVVCDECVNEQVAAHVADAERTLDTTDHPQEPDDLTRMCYSCGTIEGVVRDDAYDDERYICAACIREREGDA